MPGKRRKHAQREYFALSQSDGLLPSSGEDSDDRESAFDSDYDSSHESFSSQSVRERYYSRNLRRRVGTWDGICRMLFLLSIAGVIFLTVLMYLLSTDSVSLEISSDVAYRKPELARGVFGAVVLYAIMAFLTYSPSRTRAMIHHTGSHLAKLKSGDGEGAHST